MRNREEGISMKMNTTIKLLKVVGSPFASEHKLPESGSEAFELYNYAVKNKIGLLYLEALREQGKLEEFGLKSKYEEEKKKHDEQSITASRISELFNSSNINYAIFKSIMPFPAVLNDVDMVHLGSDKEYERAVEIMLRSGYLEVKAVDADCSQRGFHDVKRGGYSYPHSRVKNVIYPYSHEKDVYDIDIYQKIAASYLIYLDKRKLEKYVMEITISDNKLKVFQPEAELMAEIIHSIIPEQLFTGLVYYATLYHLINESFNIDKFLHIAKENNVTLPVRTHCSLVAGLHKTAHGFVPEEIEGILVELGDETRERRISLQNNFKMPHMYSLLAVTRTLLEKSKEGEFRRSIAKQAVSMLNPKLIKYVIEQVIERRRRETY